MKRALVVLAVASAAMVGLWVEPAFAQGVRTFVSGHGSDGNACSIAAPCRTFQHAHDVTASGGEIDVLDPAGYGAVTINKSISIQAHGFAGITAATVNLSAITISAAASDKIHLSGLLLDGASTGAFGVQINTARSVTIKDCSIRSFQDAGVLWSAAGSRLFIADSVIADNNSGGVGVQLQTTGHAALSRVQVVGHDFGLVADGDHLPSGGILWVSVNDSVITGSNSQALVADNHLNSATHTFVTVMVTRSSIVDNLGAAIMSNGAGSVVELNQSTIANNASGWSTANGGAMSSWSNNALSDFGAAGDGVMPPRALE